MSKSNPLVKEIEFDPRKLRPKVLDTLPDARKVLEKVKKYPGLSHKELAISLGWLPKNATTGRPRRDLLNRLVNEGFLEARVALIPTRTGKRKVNLFYLGKRKE